MRSVHSALWARSWPRGPGLTRPSPWDPQAGAALPRPQPRVLHEQPGLPPWGPAAGPTCFGAWPPGSAAGVRRRRSCLLSWDAPAPHRPTLTLRGQWLAKTRHPGPPRTSSRSRPASGACHPTAAEGHALCSAPSWPHTPCFWPIVRLPSISLFLERGVGIKRHQSSAPARRVHPTGRGSAVTHSRRLSPWTTLLTPTVVAAPVRPGPRLRPRSPEGLVSHPQVSSRALHVHEENSAGA